MIIFVALGVLADDLAAGVNPAAESGDAVGIVNGCNF